MTDIEVLNVLDSFVTPRSMSSVPVDFRVAEYPDGRKIIQGAYPYQEGYTASLEWRDLPLVKVDEFGHEYVRT